MNDRNDRNDPIEGRLDRLIDALNAGHMSSLPDDPELAGLAEAVRSADSVRETQWPDARFPRRMAARLSAELRLSGPFAGSADDRRMIDTAISPPSVNGVTPERHSDDEFALTVPRRHGRLRTFAQMAAGFAGFAILTAVLVLVFRGASDNPSLGGAPGDDAGQIAYVSSETGNAEIYLIDGDGSNKTNLTDHPARDTMPTWSPDGEQIALVSDRDGQDAIYIMNADGSDPRLFVDGDGRILLYPSWSPDGSMIAYVEAEGRGIGSQSEVIARKVDGSNWWPAQVQMDRGEDSVVAVFPPLAWSPDSSQVVFAGGGDDPGLYYWHPLSSLIGRIEVGTGRKALWPAWSPDGSKLAYAVDGTVELWEMESESSSVVDLSGNDEVVNRIAWSPDGDAFVVSLVSDQTSGLRLVSSDGSDIRSLTNDNRDLLPTWSPDGTRIAYLRETLDPQGAEIYTLMVIPPDGGGAREIASGIDSLDAGPPAWRPNTPATDEGERAEATATIHFLPQTPEPPTPTPLPGQPTAGTPSIAVVPYELTCEGSAAVIGSGYLPGATVDIYPATQEAVWPGDEPVLSTTTDETGSFQFEDLVPVTTLIPDCDALAAAGGGELNVSAESTFEGEDGERSGSGALTTIILLPHQAEASTATLTLQPAIGTCETTVKALGAGFEPGAQVTFSVSQIPGDNAIILAQHPTVLEDRTFVVDLDLRLALNCDTYTEIPESGLRFNIGVQTGLGGKQPGDAWREPSDLATFTLVPNAEIASPEALEQIMVDEAAAAAQEFLNEPEAAFEVPVATLGEAPYVRISRTVGDVYDEFTFDVTRGEIISATIQSHTSAHAPVQPVTAEQALEIAEAIASEYHAGFDQLTLYETFDQGTIPGGDGQDQVFTATWQLKVNDQVWVPTTLQVDIDMQTGLALGYRFDHIPYRGPLDPQLTQEDAVATVEQAIATEPTVAGATIGTVELATSYSPAAEEWILVWRAHLENAPAEAPSKYIEVDALTGELLTDFGEPGGLG